MIPFQECPFCGGGPLYRDRWDQKNGTAHCDDCGAEIPEDEYMEIVGGVLPELPWLSYRRLEMEKMANKALLDLTVADEVSPAMYSEYLAYAYGSFSNRLEEMKGIIELAHVRRINDEAWNGKPVELKDWEDYRIAEMEQMADSFPEETLNSNAEPNVNAALFHCYGSGSKRFEIFQEDRFNRYLDKFEKELKKEALYG